MLRDTFFLVTLCLVTRETQATSEFPCGFDVCERRGYVACVTSAGDEAGDDSYCLTCTRERAKCATPQELSGCNLFCHEVVRNDTIDEMESLRETLKGELRATKAVATGLGVTLACLIVVGLAAAIYFLYRHCKARTTADAEKGCKETNDCAPNQDSGETSRLVVADGRPETPNIDSNRPARTSTADQPDSRTDDVEPDDARDAREVRAERQSREPSTCTEGPECPAMKKLNNVPPTEDHHSINLCMPDNKHPALRRQQAYGITNGHVANGVANGQVANGVANGHVANGVANGQVVNGVANGHVANGVTNGHVANGVANGHVANGVTNGHVANGVANGHVANGVTNARVANGHVAVCRSET